MKNLSIIVPMYNAEKYIGRCIDSILGQGLPETEYEIILVDDGSKDRTLEIARSYADRFSMIKVLSQTNGGVSKARNNGLNNAVGKYIQFIDGDDALLPNSLINVYKYISKDWILESNHGISPEIVTFRSVIGTGDILTPSNQDTETLNHYRLSSGKKFIEDNNYNNSVWWYFVERKLIDKLNLRFELGKIAQDAPFTARLLTAAKRVVATDVECYFYSYNDQSATRSNNINKSLRVMDGEIYASTELHKLMTEFPEMAPKCRKRLESKRDLMIFNALLMAIKYLSLSDARKVLADFRTKGMYPFNGKSLCSTTLDRILLMVVSYPMFFYSANIFNKFVGVLRKN